jgi:H+/Cl- antiporter ClcA
VIVVAAAVVLTGLAAGVVGTGLTLVLHLVQHVAFGYTENTFLVGVERASPARRLVALAAGGLLVGAGWWGRRRWVDNEAVSVTHALREPRPRLPVLATLSDALLQIVAVGTGASMGREGAPRQGAAAIAGWIAERLAVDARAQRRLLACGAGAGLAAVYNVPLGGAAFTLEVLLGSLALADVAAAIAASALATVVAWPLLGDRPTYPIPTVHLDAPVLVWSLLLAPIVGVTGVLFSRVMTRARTHAPTGWRAFPATVVVFIALGALASAYPELLGNGKGMTGLAFDGVLGLGTAGVLVLLKPLATALCLGGGAIGGLLTPALATGAAAGIFVGRLWSMLWPGAAPVEYAMVAAAALLAVTMRAPITAVLLVLEFTHTGTALLLPMLACVAGATVTARRVEQRRASRPRPLAARSRSMPARPPSP